MVLTVLPGLEQLLLPLPTPGGLPPAVGSTAARSRLSQAIATESDVSAGQQLLLLLESDVKLPAALGIVTRQQCFTMPLLPSSGQLLVLHAAVLEQAHLFAACMPQTSLSGTTIGLSSSS